LGPVFKSALREPFGLASSPSRASTIVIALLRLWEPTLCGSGLNCFSCGSCEPVSPLSARDVATTAFIGHLLGLLARHKGACLVQGLARASWWSIFVSLGVFSIMGGGHWESPCVPGATKPRVKEGGLPRSTTRVCLSCLYGPRRRFSRGGTPRLQALLR